MSGMTESWKHPDRYRCSNGHEFTGITIKPAPNCVSCGMPLELIEEET